MHRVAVAPFVDQRLHSFTCEPVAQSHSVVPIGRIVASRECWAAVVNLGCWCGFGAHGFAADNRQAGARVKNIFAQFVLICVDLCYFYSMFPFRMPKPKHKTESVRFTFTTTPEKAKDAEQIRAGMGLALPRATFVRSMFETGLVIHAETQAARRSKKGGAS